MVKLFFGNNSLIVLCEVAMDIGRINNIRKSLEHINNVGYKSSDISAKSIIEKGKSSSQNNNKNIMFTQDMYGAEHYLMNNTNILYSNVNREFIRHDKYKVNKSSYSDAAKKYKKNN